MEKTPRPLRSAAIAACGAAVIVAASAGALALRRDNHPASRLAGPVTVNGTAGAVLPNGWQVTPAGRPLPLPGDLPVNMRISPNGKYLVVSMSGYHDHGVSVIDIASEKTIARAPLLKDWPGLCFDPTGSTLYVAAGQGVDGPTLAAAIKDGASPARQDAFQQTVLRMSFSATDGQLTKQDGVKIPELEGKEHWTSGLTTAKDGSLYVVQTEANSVYKIDPAQSKTLATGTVGYRPYTTALSPDGKTLAVSNWGDKSVSLLDPETLKETARVAVGTHPNEIVWSSDSKRLFVANAGSDSVSVVAPDGKVLETVRTTLDPKAPVGSTPIALALSPDGKRLYVANANNNAVAVVDISGDESTVVGFIPTGWYPSALAVSPDGKKLFVGNGKGLGFRGNFPPQASDPLTSYDGKNKFDYIGKVLSGSVSVIDTPDPKKLAAYTKQVYANVPLPAAKIVNKQQIADVTKNAFGKIKHVLYIIRENRTYDQVFGDVKVGNGDPQITMYGESVTPNAHALARNTVLLDNLYCNGEVSESGHQWCDAAYATDFTEKAWSNSYSDRGEPDADERLTASPAGYIWDNCAKHNVSFRTYGEFSSFKSNPNSPPTFTGYPSLNGHACPGWDYSQHRDPQLVDLFIDELHQGEKSGEWPRFMVMSLGEDHTSGLRAGKFTPNASVASNDQALGKIVDAVSHSKFWQDTAIFVIEDDAQNGPDHVDAHRTVGLVISPYVKHGAVDSTLYSTASFVHTMELILGLPPMTQYDAAATPLYNSFTGTPVMTAFNLLPAQVDVFAKNPDKTEGAKQSARLDWSGYDRADPDALNAILWNDAHPDRPLPAPTRSGAMVAWR